MFFEVYKSILYSDTLIPDIFLSEYMPSMDGDHLKVYLHCLFLSKHNKHATTKELSKKLGIDVNKVKDALIYLESVGIITKKENSNSIMLTDLKEKEIKKVYRLKSTSTPEDVAQSTERNKKRNAIISAINKQFFQGLMSPSWYTDIDTWFDRYKFDEDVMMSLFQHSYDHNAFNKNYIVSVAENWHRKNIINSFDLDNYFIEYNKFKDIRGKIVKKLKLNRNLTEYEEKLLEKWVIDYKFAFDIIEIALIKTTAKTNPNFKYINAIIEDWYNKGFRTPEEIANYDSLQRSAPKKSSGDTVPQKGNFEQRQYDDSFYDNLYDNVKKIAND